MMLTAPITINPEKAYCGIPTRVHFHLPGQKEGKDGPGSGSHSKLYTNGWRLKQQTNGNAIMVYGQKPMLDNSIEKDWIV